ncbi:MAG: hypothetical protein GX971_13385 [Firmicutes bacterium]|nr:hypothetical protein [Bacillota bacterium]
MKEMTWDEYYAGFYDWSLSTQKRGLILDDSKYDGMATGLPFHIPFVVRRKHK